MSHMNDRAKLIAALGVSTITGVVVAAFALTAELPGASKSLAATHLDTAAVPICSIESDATEPTFYSEMARVNGHMHETMEIAPQGNVERDFVRMMIPHHQGAIDMALVLLKYGHDERLKRLAQSIIVEQGQEIAYMRTLLDGPAGETSARRNADH
jgi:uncharacterized protein (DUF305 family)